MTYSFLVPPVPEADEWINPESVRDERAGADAPEQDIRVRNRVAVWSAPSRSSTGDTLQDALTDVWEDAGRPHDCYRTWWEQQLAFWSDHAQYKLRRGRNGHLHAAQGTDIVARVFERMAARARSCMPLIDRDAFLPPRTWLEFRRYMYTAIEHMCQDLGNLVRVDVVSAPWESHADSDDDGKYWSPADTHPDADPHAPLDAETLGELIRAHTTMQERELLLFVWGGHTADSIAETTGGKRETVKKRITRLRSRLKPILAEHGYGWESRERGDKLRSAAAGNVRGMNRTNVPDYPSFPLNKVERVKLSRVAVVPEYSGDTHVKTNAPVTVSRRGGCLLAAA